MPPRTIRTQWNMTLHSDAPDNSKQQSRDILQQLIEQLPGGYLLDILTTEAPDFHRAINDDICFIDYRAQLAQQQQHLENLAAINEQIVAARNALTAKNLEICKAQRRLDEIEETRREMRNLLKAV